MTPGIQLEYRADGILILSLDRPERRNAFDEDMAREMQRIFAGPAHEPDVRAVIIRSSSENFSAGFDIKSRPKLDAERGIALVADTYLALSRIPVLTVALVDGVAYGGALGFLATCDMVVATRAARFSCPEGRHGQLPGAMALFLVQAVGHRNAMAMIATAAPISAPSALAWGLVSEVVEDANGLRMRAADIMSDVLETGPAMARSAKSLLWLLRAPIADDVVREAVRRAVESRQGAEAREGFKAFREGRLAAWRKHE